MHVHKRPPWFIQLTSNLPRNRPAKSRRRETALYAKKHPKLATDCAPEEISRQPKSSAKSSARIQTPCGWSKGSCGALETVSIVGHHGLSKSAITKSPRTQSPCPTPHGANSPRRAHPARNSKSNTSPLSAPAPLRRDKGTPIWLSCDEMS